MKTLYFDCFSGISGDMTLGALVDSGLNPKLIEKELKKLHLQHEYELKWTRVVKEGISATKLDVIVHNEDQHHGHRHEHTHGHDHHQEHHHNHDDHHDHSDHEHRHYHHIVDLIKAANFSDKTTRYALGMFKVIGQAEAKIHDIPIEKVHFHEVGAIDSIIDIVGTAIAIDLLNIERFVSSSVPVGCGKIHIDHGHYPVPAPATLEILKGIPLQQSHIQSELTTPTGAAILAFLAESYGPLPAFKTESIGYGAGTKDFPKHPNVLRVVIGNE